MRIAAPLGGGRGGSAMLLAALIASATGCAARSRASPFMTDSCPLPPGPRYGVVADAPDGPSADSAFLDAVARAVVSYWDPTGSRPKLEAQSPEAARGPAMAPPRDSIVYQAEWRPQPQDTAELAFTMRRGGAVASVRFLEGAPDSPFGRSLLEGLREAERWRNEGRVASDTLPRELPGGAGDSLVISLRFGAVGESRPARGVVLKFARQFRPAVSVIGNRAPRYPERLRDRGVEGNVLVQFQVTPEGTVRDGSLRVLRSHDLAFTHAVLDVLPGFRFTPATIDCERVFQLVQLPFAFRLARPPRPDPGSVPP